MKVGACALLLLLAATVPALAGPPSQTFPVPLEKAWTTTEKVLKHLGWEIDQADRSIGWITTDSRRLSGEGFGVYEKGLRHRLRILLKADGEHRTTITVERSVFKRERILWIDSDEPVKTDDQSVEKSLLTAIGQAF